MNHLQLLTALKRELKARDLTYAVVAQRIDMSEASVKRMLSSGRLGLDQLDAILTATGIDWGDLIQEGQSNETLIERLPINQETAIVSQPILFLTAVCTMNGVSADTMLQEFSMTEAELVHALTKLDRMGFLKLQEGNRYQLKLSRTFQWQPNGPIQTFFREGSQDYLAREFNQINEHFQVVNVMLTEASSQKMIRRMRELAQEINALHLSDTRMPFAQRGAQTMVLAMRPWLPPVLRKLRKSAV